MGRLSVLEPKIQGRWDSLKNKLLLADEDLTDLQRYSAALNQLGYQVRAFASYGEAAACLGQEIFDLVVVSQGTSKFEGRTVLVRAIEKDRHTPVLVITDSIEIPCYLEAVQLGARDYLLKPLPPAEIGKLVARYLTPRPGSA